ITYGDLIMQSKSLRCKMLIKLGANRSRQCKVDFRSFDTLMAGQAKRKDLLLDSANKCRHNISHKESKKVKENDIVFEIEHD
ncbi:MAG: hypothetical protein WC476_13500, partial [Phycisphaerae bacterium]